MTSVRNGVHRIFLSCKYLHDNNYDDLAIMRSSAPRAPVSCAAVGLAVSPWRGLCA